MIQRLLPIAMLLLAASSVAAQPLVCIDAGHGGDKLGAVAVNGRLEKDLALEIAQRLRAALETGGKARVMMTREEDVGVGLVERIDRANEAGAALFVSVHLNSMPYGPIRRKAQGVETYFLSAEATGEQAQRVAALENAEDVQREEVTGDLASILADLARTEAHRDASALAYAVHQPLVRELGARDRGVHQAPFVVLMGAQMPAILLEAGFVSHPTEVKTVSSPAYHERIARSVARSIEAFLERMARREESAGGVAESQGIPEAGVAAKPELVSDSGDTLRPELAPEPGGARKSQVVQEAGGLP